MDPELNQGAAPDTELTPQTTEPVVDNAAADASTGSEAPVFDPVKKPLTQEQFNALYGENKRTQAELARIKSENQRYQEDYQLAMAQLNELQRRPAQPQMDMGRLEQLLGQAKRSGKYPPELEALIASNPDNAALAKFVEDLLQANTSGKIGELEQRLAQMEQIRQQEQARFQEQQAVAQASQGIGQITESAAAQVKLDEQPFMKAIPDPTERQAFRDQIMAMAVNSAINSFDAQRYQHATPQMKWNFLANQINQNIQGQVQRFNNLLRFSNEQHVQTLKKNKNGQPVVAGAGSAPADVTDTIENKIASGKLGFDEAVRLSMKKRAEGS